MKHVLVAFALALLAAAAAPAELALLAAAAAPADADVHSKPLTLHTPAPAARALQYALLPELRDTTPGNAADHYRQAVKNMKQDAPPSKDWYPTLDQWMAVPLNDFPRDDVAKFLNPCECTFREVEAGARCEQCDWRLTEELRTHGLKGLDPAFSDMTGLRAIAALLTLRVRYELAQGRTGQAAHTLQIGFALARRLAGAPILITALVGIAVSSLMLDQLEELIQQPGAPNFYWALTDLPRPFIDLRRPLQGERVFFNGLIPGVSEMVSDLNAKPWTPEQVEAVVAAFRQMDKNNALLGPILGEKLEEEKLLHLAARQEGIRKTLIDEGRPKELVDAMPDIQAALLVALRHYDAMFDELLKWQSLPFWEAHPAMAKAEEEPKEGRDEKDTPTVALARLFRPNASGVFAAQVRIDRRIAALRCVETVRLYAAVHDGKFPVSLDNVKDMPIPADPVTGQPFAYRQVGERAFLSCTPFPGQPAANANTPTYELMFQR